MGYIYFVQVGSCGDIKIGYSKNIKHRMKTLQTAIPENIKLLGYVSGDMGREKEIHKMFRKFKLKGEWFRCVPEIVEFLNSVNELTIHCGMQTYIELNEDGYTMLYGKIKRN